MYIFNSNYSFYQLCFNCLLAAFCSLFIWVFRELAKVLFKGSEANKGLLIAAGKQYVYAGFDGILTLAKASLILIFCACSLTGTAQQNPSIDRKVKELLARMTLDEKIGQMNQYTGDRLATGPVKPNSNKYNDIVQGKLGSMLNVQGAKDTRLVQEFAMQSRLKIPLLFGMDVIHGYRVTFPVPLAEAASWDLGAIELSARIAATEAAAAGIHWTFAPMVDIARDPRWGRVTEGAGEDPYLGSLIAKARVNGFQGKKLGDLDAVMALSLIHI